MENNFHRQPRSGWNSRENELLAQQVRQAKGARLPLRTAFEAVARATASKAVRRGSRAPLACRTCWASSSFSRLFQPLRGCR